MQRLTPEDSRILALESGAIVGHTCKVLIAERTGDTVAYLRDRIARRIGLAPRCRQRIADGSLPPRALRSGPTIPTSTPPATCAPFRSKARSTTRICARSSRD